ncbi:MAG: DUF2834 domain-containing protein [Gemmatimonadetes bacterium]|nr:DUF2834 domain-containing protein [Gemmatimonadota bacterium]
MLRRYGLVAFAILFFIYEQVAFNAWITQNGGVGAGLQHAWAALRTDPMVFMAWNDMAVFTAVVLVWLWRDIRRSGRNKLWWPATLLIGCPSLLIYLAHRPDTPASPHGATS